MFIDILFLLGVGAVWSWINQKVREDSGGQYNSWLDALLDGLGKAQDSLENLPEPAQIFFGFILGILESAGRFIDTTTTDITEATESLGDFFYNIGTILGDATFQSLGKIADKIKNLHDLLKEEIEEKIQPAVDMQSKLQERIAEALEAKTRGVGTILEEMKNNIKTAIQDQIEESKRITTNIDYILRDQTHETITELDNLWDDMMNKALETLYDAETVADTYLNRDIFNTTLQMNMWADLFEAATTIDEEKARENLRKQLAVYKDLYFEALKQYKEIAEKIKEQSARGA